MSARIREFTKKDPELNRRLVQLEDSFFGEVNALSERIDLSVVALVLRAGYIARPGQFVRVLKPVELLLTKPKQSERGRPLIVWNGSGGLVTIRPVESTLDGLATGVLVGSGTFIHDGDNWFSVSLFDALPLAPNSLSAGPYNTAVINAAIVRASTAGAARAGPVAVLLPAGKFWIAGWLTMLSNVTLRGAGMGATTLYMPAARFTNTVNGTRSATSVAIAAQGELSGSFTPLTNVTLEDFSIESEVSDGRYLYPVMARNVAGLNIRRVEVSGIPAGNLITLDTVVRSEVSHCYLHECTSAVVTSLQITGIETDGSRVNSVNCRNLKIYDNTIENLTMTGAALPGGVNMQTDGINLGAGTAHGVLVYDNYIKNVGEGIDCFASESVLHSNNLVDCFNVGLKFIHGASRNNAYGNTIMRPGLAGIYFGGSASASAADNYVHDNNIHDVNPTDAWNVGARAIAAIRLDNAGGAAFQPSGNTIARNKVTGGGSFMRHIVRQDDGTDNRFIDNEGDSWLTSYSSVAAGTYTILNAKKALVRASVGTLQTIASGAGEVVVNYKTEQLDTQNEYTAATPIYTTNSHRRLHVRAQVRVPTTTLGELFVLRIRKNGVSQAYTNYVVARADEICVSIADTFEVVPGDTVTVGLLNNSVASRDITADSGLSFFTIEEVAS